MPRLYFKSLLFFLGAVVAITTASCTKMQEISTPTAPAPILTKDEMIEKGRHAFQMNCLSCHGHDPKVDGPVGPAIAGSSLELITKRVMEVKYPDGYKPKRTTSLMVALPHLKNDIPYLFEYLTSEKNEK